MTITKLILGCALVAGLAACGHPSPVPGYKGVDRGIVGQKHLSQLQAGIWIDPEGCDHWIIDDGVEGYLSARLDPYGKPVCSGTAAPNIATGGFKRGSDIPDPNRAKGGSL